MCFTGEPLVQRHWLLTRADQLITEVSGRAGAPRSGSDACSLGQDVVAAIGDLAQLQHIESVFDELGSAQQTKIMRLLAWGPRLTLYLRMLW